MYFVKDLSRASAFYRDVLGLTPTKEYPGIAVEFTLNDGATFCLYKRRNRLWHAGDGVLFAVSDLRTALEQYRSRGVKFEDDGEIEETEVCFVAFARDSEGNRFGLHQRKIYDDFEK